jgi:hypothetical protein
VLCRRKEFNESAANHCKRCSKALPTTVKARACEVGIGPIGVVGHTAPAYSAGGPVPVGIGPIGVVGIASIGVVGICQTGVVGIAPIGVVGIAPFGVVGICQVGVAGIGSIGICSPIGVSGILRWRRLRLLLQLRLQLLRLLLQELSMVSTLLLLRLLPSMASSWPLRLLLPMMSSLDVSIGGVATGHMSPIQPDRVATITTQNYPSHLAQLRH